MKSKKCVKHDRYVYIVRKYIHTFIKFNTANKPLILSWFPTCSFLPDPSV